MPPDFRPTGGSGAVPGSAGAPPGPGGRGEPDERIAAVLTSVLLALALAGAPAPFGPSWNALVGEWRGEGKGSPGEGSGVASFRFELEGHVLVRRNVADYPAAGSKPAVHHEDLMVVYPGASPAEARAIYFDNESRVIEYTASWSADGRTLTFVSSASAPGPRFRLVYKVLGPDRISVDFDIAPPGAAEFKTYVSGVTVRVKP